MLNKTTTFRIIIRMMKRIITMLIRDIIIINKWIVRQIHPK